MSGALAHEVFRREMPEDAPTFARDVLVAYCLHARADGSEARPKQETVAWQVGCSTRTVRRRVRFWKDMGVMIEVLRQRKMETGGALSTIYSIDLSPLPLKPEAQHVPASTVPTVAVTSRGTYRPDWGDVPDRAGYVAASLVREVLDERPLERPLERPSVSRFQEAKHRDPEDPASSTASSKGGEVEEQERSEERKVEPILNKRRRPRGGSDLAEVEGRAIKAKRQAALGKKGEEPKPRSREEQLAWLKREGSDG